MDLNLLVLIIILVIFCSDYIVSFLQKRFFQSNRKSNQKPSLEVSMQDVINANLEMINSEEELPDRRSEVISRLKTTEEHYARMMLLYGAGSYVKGEDIGTIEEHFCQILWKLTNDGADALTIENLLLEKLERHFDYQKNKRNIIWRLWRGKL